MHERPSSTYYASLCSVDLRPRHQLHVSFVCKSQAHPAHALIFLVIISRALAFDLLRLSKWCLRSPLLGGVQLPHFHHRHRIRVQQVAAPPLVLRKADVRLEATAAIALVLVVRPALASGRAHPPGQSPARARPERRASRTRLLVTGGVTREFANAFSCNNQCYTRSASKVRNNSSAGNLRRAAPCFPRVTIGVTNSFCRTCPFWQPAYRQNARNTRCYTRIAPESHPSLVLPPNVRSHRVCHLCRRA